MIQKIMKLATSLVNNFLYLGTWVSGYIATVEVRNSWLKINNYVTLQLIKMMKVNDK